MPNSQYGKRQIEEDDEEELKDLFTQVFHIKQKWCLMIFYKKM